MALQNILSVLLPMTLSVDISCDYFQFMEIGREYFIYNRDYPKNYNPGTNCRWVAQSPEYSRIVMMCPDVNIPPSENCREDFLSISLTGDSSLVDSHRYCGSGTLNLVSQSNSMSLGLFSPWYSKGGRFTCSLTAIQDDIIFPTQPPTTPRPSKCDCGKRKPRRIVGGTQTGINEFPYMAGLKPIIYGEIFCGATIISNRYAITAAHCLTNKDAKDLGLLVGEHDVTTGFETNAAFLYQLEKFIIHPYNVQDKENDIAILKTKEVIIFSEEVGPVCLPFKYTNKDFSGESVTVLGWGTTEFSGPKSDYLLSANLSVVTNEMCQNELKPERIYPTHICTTSVDKDACQYDSGGPLIWYSKSSRRDQLLGIISYGKACASGVPGVNTRVPSYLAWIASETKDAAYCFK